MTPRDTLPTTLRRLHRAAGMIGVRALVGALAGRRIWIPADGFADDHQVRRALAEYSTPATAAAVLESLAADYGANWYEVPMGAALARYDRDQDIRRRRRRGQAVPEIAEATGLTRRHVRRILESCAAP